MGNKAKKRTQSNATTRRSERTLSFLGIAIGLGAWGYFVINPAPNTIVATALFAGAFVCLLAASWMHFTWRMWVKTALVVLLAVGFCWADWRWVIWPPRPYCYGVLVKDNDNLMISLFNPSGRTINNVTVVLADDRKTRSINDFPHDFVYAVYSSCGAVPTNIHAPLKDGLYLIAITTQDGMYLTEEIKLTVSPWSQKINLSWMNSSDPMKVERDLLMDYSPPLDEYGGCAAPS